MLKGWQNRAFRIAKRCGRVVRVLRTRISDDKHGFWRGAVGLLLHRNRRKVSVIVPSYNVETYLAECVNSILHQSFKAFELIIVNDGSTDNTLDVARALRRSDRRIRVISQENAGLSMARNVGTDAAKGDFIMYVDSDDTLPQDALRAMVTSIEASGSDLVVGKYARKYSGGRMRVPQWIQLAHAERLVSTHVSAWPQIMANVIAMPKLYRRSLLVDNHIRFVPGVLYEDQEFAARVYTSAAAIDVLPDLVYHWRVRDEKDSISQQTAVISNTLGLLDALEAALRTYGESSWPDLRRIRFAHLLKADLPPLATTAANSGQEHREKVRERFSALIEAAGVETLRESPIVARLRVYYAWRGEWNALLDFNELLRTEGIPLPRECHGDVLYVRTSTLPEIAGEHPSWLYALTLEETGVTAALCRVEWQSCGLLRLEGWAFVRGLSTSETATRIEASLVNSETGESISLEVAQSSDPWPTVWARHSSASYDDSYISATVRTDDVDFSGPGNWEVHVRLHHNDFVRSGPITHLLGGGSAGRLLSSLHEQRGISGYVVPSFNATRGLSLSFRAHSVVASELATGERSGDLSATFRPVRGRKDLVGVIAVNRKNHQVTRGKLAKTAGGDYRAHLQLSRRGQLHKRDEKWEIFVVDVSGSRRLVNWLEAEYETRGHEGKLAPVWTRTPRGYLEVAIDCPTIAIQSTRVDDSSIEIVVRTTGVSKDELQSAFLTSRSFEIPVDSIAERHDGSFSLSFATRASLFGSVLDPLPAGSYHLVARVAADDADSHSRVYGTVEWDDLPAAHATWELRNFRAETLRLKENSEFRLWISAPLRNDERGRNAQARLHDWYQRTDFQPLDAVLFQCYRGEIAADSQRALHEGLRASGSSLALYWGVSDLSVRLPRGGIPVLIGSRQWYQIVGSARYLCNNIDFDRFFRRRSYQQVISTFHGYPFKSMGISEWEVQGMSDYRVGIEIARRQNAWSSIVVPSEETGQMYKDQYRYDGRILVTGYPRNDRLLTDDRESVRRETLAKLCVPSSNTVVLFAPTWRESRATGAWSAKIFDALDLRLLAAELGDDFTILVRGHNFNARDSSRKTGSQIVDVTDYPDINDLIHAADAAILDYSSLRFDWALTRRPAVFFVPDKDRYLALRPGLFDYDLTTPGPQLTNTGQVVDALRDVDALAAVCAPLVTAFNARFNVLNDGQATRRVIDAAFAGAVVE